MMKSCTIEPRAGNPEPRYADVPLGSINSMGLPNLGYKKYIEFAQILKKYNKPIIASVSGFSIEDYKTMVSAFQKSEADLIEVNLSCPNVIGKPQVGYDIEQSENILKQISNLGDKPIGLKLPPYLDIIHRKQIAEIIKKYNISFIVCINSVGNTLIIDGEKETPLIKPNNGMGGLGGDYIKPIALANVRTFYELLGDKVAIIGAGGIKTGMDAFEFLLAGATAVQVGTIFEQEGSDCFARINQELETILAQKNYSSIQDVLGKLKYL